VKHLALNISSLNELLARQIVEVIDIAFLELLVTDMRDEVPPSV
jgi:hypothetical protein